MGEGVKILRGGGIVGLPTETVYGLAADAFQPLAVARVFDAKQRPISDPLIVHLPETSWLDRVARFTSQGQEDLVKELAAAFWPGPLTILLQKHPDLPDLVTAGSDQVAVRVTSHPYFQEVLRQLGSPIAAPSANRFGRISPTSAEDVRIELGEVISLILDAGPCCHGLESTILSLEDHGMRILRPGPVTMDQLKKFGHFSLSESIVNTPGSLPGHYAPRKELQIFESDIIADQKGGLLAFRTPTRELAGSFAAVEVLSSNGDLREAAATFYGALRKLDQSDAVRLYAESVPSEGIGVAIMDRLRRASWGSKNKKGHPAGIFSR